MMSEEMQPHYYMNIPAFVWDDTDLLRKPKAILLYGHISTLANKKGYCWATNDYFAKQLKVDKRTVIDYVNLLVEKGYIKRKIFHKENSKEVEKRILSIFTTPSDTDFTRSGDSKFTTPSDVDFTENNTSINNTSTNKSSSSTACDFLDNSTKDIESKNAFELYQITVGVLTPTQNQILSEYIQSLSDEVVQFAINSMANQTERRSFNYLNRILMRYEQLGIHTVEQAEKLEKQHQESLKRVRPKQKKKSKRKNTLPF